jgi:hypothetical protein
MCCIRVFWGVSRASGKRGTHADALIVDRGQLGVDGVLAGAVLEELAEGEEGRAVEEHFCDEAAGAEDVHGLCDAVAGVGEGGLVEALRREVAGAAAAGVVEEGKVGGVVEGETGGLVGGKVDEVYPVCGGDEDVGGLDVAVGGVLEVGEGEGGEELVDDPRFLDGGEKGAGAGAVSRRRAEGEGRT